MKKFVALLLCVLMLPLFAATETNSEGNVVVQLDGVEFFFAPIPDGACLTRESEKTEYTELGMTWWEVRAWMMRSGIYALMYDQDMTCEIYIYALPIEAADYDDLNEFGEITECAYYKSYLTEHGYDVDTVIMHRVPGGHKFIKTNASYKDELGNVQHMGEYMTCKGGYDIRIAIFPMVGEVTGAHFALADAIAESMRITKVNSLDMSGN